MNGGAVALALLCATTAGAAGTTAGAPGAVSCRGNDDCTRPWSGCWMLGSCAAGRCLYEPLGCAGGQACADGQCVASSLRLSSAVEGNRFRLTLTNGSARAAAITIDPHRAVVDALECSAPAQPPDTLPDATISPWPWPPADGARSASPPPRSLPPGGRVTVDVELIWITPDDPPVSVRYNVKKGSACSVTFLYRLDDGSLVAAAPLRFKR